MSDRQETTMGFIIQRERDGTFFVEEDGGAYVWGGRRAARRFAGSLEAERWLHTLRFHFGPCRVVEVRK